MDSWESWTGRDRFSTNRKKVTESGGLITPNIVKRNTPLSMLVSSSVWEVKTIAWKIIPIVPPKIRK